MVTNKSSVSTEEKVRALEASFRENGIQSANNLIEILSHISPDSSACIRALHSSRRILANLERVSIEPKLSEWLISQRQVYVKKIQGLLTNLSTSKSIIDAAVAAAALSHSSVWKSTVQTALQNSQSRYTHLIFSELSVRFGDLRAESLQELCQVADKIQPDFVLSVLNSCNATIPSQSARGEAVPEKLVRRYLIKTWLVLMRRSDLEEDQLCQILGRIPTELIPFMDDPLSLADFLISAYNSQNIAIAIAALDGLFVLISKHSLDYPRFYFKLYTLLTEEAMFYITGRDQFLNLIAAFLRFGTNLSGSMIAAFIKRLLRRALVAPAAGALWSLRLALDLLYKHPTLHHLVHKSINLFDSNSDGSIEMTVKIDPFDDEQEDPEKSHAEESSLWELEVLKQHFSPAVSRLVAAFAKDLRKNPPRPPGDLSDYNGLTFEDLFQAEVKRKAKSVHVAYHAPSAAPHVEQVRNALSSCTSWN